jgi:hypothetical protein
MRLGNDRRRRGQRTSTSADMIAAVRQLVLIANNDLIADLRQQSEGGALTGGEMNFGGR